MEYEIETRLGKLWSGVIKEFKVDLWARHITLRIDVTRGHSTESHEVLFDGVAAMYYVADEGEERRHIRALDTNSGDILEASEIAHLAARPPLIRLARTFKEGLPTYPSTPNFYIEMSLSVVYIEARSVAIDGEAFDVGYPAAPYGGSG